MVTRIGVISGVAEELAAVFPGRPRITRDTGAGPAGHLVCGDKELYLLCAGIGKVAAATAAVCLHADFGVELLAVVGTAGKIGASAGHLFNIVEAVQADFGAQRPGGLVHYTAGSWPIGDARVEPFRAVPLPELALPQVRIATSDMFIECPDHAAILRNLGASLVDMETGAVAQTAGLLGIGWIAIKATTDEADQGSAASFVANLNAAARASAAALEAIIPRL